MFGKTKQRLQQRIDLARSMGIRAGKGDERAQANVGSMARVAIALVVSLTVGGLVAAFLLPVGIDEIVGVDTSNWSTGAQSMWDILDVVLVLAVMLFFFGITLAAVDLVE